MRGRWRPSRGPRWGRGEYGVPSPRREDESASSSFRERVMSVALRVEIGAHGLQGSRVERLEVRAAVGSPIAFDLVVFCDAGSLGELDARAAAITGGSGGPSANGASGDG